MFKSDATSKYSFFSLIALQLSTSIILYGAKTTNYIHRITNKTHPEEKDLRSSH